MSYEAIADLSNPFATAGLSREDKAILDYVLAAKTATGVDVVATATTDHPKYTTSGNLSRHRMAGTDGEGLAVDLRMRTRSTARGFHRAVFELFVPVETLCYELIYAYPPTGKRADGSTGPYNIKNGRRVAPYAVADHTDHVHVSVGKGTLLVWPHASPAPVNGSVFPDGPDHPEEAVRNYIAIPPTNPLDSKGDGFFDLPFRYEDVLGISTVPPQPSGDSDITAPVVTGWRNQDGRPRVPVDSGEAGGQYAFRVLSAGPPVDTPGWTVTSG